jgi:hypothetical protein
LASARTPTSAGCSDRSRAESDPDRAAGPGERRADRVGRQGNHVGVAGDHVGRQPSPEHRFDGPHAARARDREEPPEDLNVLVPRQGEVEAPVDRPASLVHAVAHRHSCGSPESARDSARCSGRIRPAGGRASGPTGAGLPSARISGPRELRPYRGRRGSAQPGRASAWVRFMAAPVRSLHLRCWRTRECAEF